ncbi:MAG: 16S rRNA (cytidine(1402)-2'-O)-methyltransferase [Paracoccaceae bacterium]|nr:16S rRNA (cytidine(1402)-2'-O)-methyltransferase [Paracoccaceae bacterium]
MWQKTDLAPGLYLVSTPIGAARDITLRALDVLASADVLAAEDTRTLRRLMDIHGIPLGQRLILAYHDHNGPRMRPRLLALLAQGKSVAYASEAGTPLVADPGYVLAREAIAMGLPVTAVPGASAVLAALAVAGLPTDRFLFAGFPPNAPAARRRFLEELAGIEATLILYESPKRVGDLLTDLVQAFGAERRAVVCRELTKKFEEALRGTLGELAARLAGQEVKGEVVVLVDRGEKQAASAEDLDAALSAALGSMRVKEAAETVSKALGLPRREVYQAALRLAGEK